MSYLFKISKEEDKSYEENYKVRNNIYLNYNTKEYMKTYSKDSITIICYGYCFDVRNPDRNTQETLLHLVESDNIDNSIQFLNGQYVLIVLKNSILHLYTDASSITPVYFSRNDSVITNQVIESNKEFYQLNPAYKINLDNLHLKRIDIENSKFKNLDNQSLIEYFISLFYNQYKYFLDKNLFVPFKADNFTKSLFAIIGPALYDNTILLDSSKATEKDKQFSEIFKNEFRMFIKEETNWSSNINYLCKNNLSNFDAIYTKKREVETDEHLMELYGDSEENLLNHEFNLMQLNISSNLKSSQRYLIYEPLNCREILNIFIELQQRMNFKIHISLIDNLKESLKYYNFTNGKTLSEIYINQKNKLSRLIDNSMESPTQKFLLDVKTSNFEVSQNLTGKLKSEELIVYPARQKISKSNEYIIHYQHPEEGLIFIEGFYKNKKNANRIKVWINEEEFNIVDLYGGRYFYFKEECTILMRYMQNYESLSWQKAGTIAIKKI